MKKTGIAWNANQSGDTAWHLGPFFGSAPHFWLNLQTSSDLRILEHAGAHPKIQLLAAAG